MLQLSDQVKEEGKEKSGDDEVMKRMDGWSGIGQR